MNKLELMKTANEVRKGHRYCSSQCKSPDIRVDHCQQQTFIHICILKR